MRFICSGCSAPIEMSVLAPKDGELCIGVYGHTHDAELAARVTAREFSLDEAEARYQHLRDRLLLVEVDRAKTTEENTELRRRAVAAEERLQLLGNPMSDVAGLRRHLEVRGELCGTLRRDLDAAQSALEAVRGERDNLVLEIRRMKSEFDQRRTRVGFLELELAAALKANNTLRDELLRAEKARYEVEREHNQLKAHYGELGVVLNAQRAANAVLEKERDEARAGWSLERGSCVVGQTEIGRLQAALITVRDALARVLPDEDSPL